MCLLSHRTHYRDGLLSPQVHALVDMISKCHQAFIAAAKGRAIRLNLMYKILEVETDLEVRPEVLHMDDATNLHTLT
jgi:hypothetical protein